MKVEPRPCCLLEFSSTLQPREECVCSRPMVFSIQLKLALAIWEQHHAKPRPPHPIHLPTSPSLSGLWVLRDSGEMSVYTEQHTNLKCFTLGPSLCHGVGLQYTGTLEICAHPFEGSWHLELSMMTEPAAGQGALSWPERGHTVPHMEPVLPRREV